MPNDMTIINQHVHNTIKECNAEERILTRLDAQTFHTTVYKAYGY
jgi:hypothetical protein